ncbi:hypothetical protein H7X46_10945 [Pseudonocardia sp. C8]|uniref:hypothetical protein n=1 Tax=Pseudonocardia sp. C8 TaxID=2762759 RepID=UPI001643538C|nr:hypothetical protein [Pseudonocardia sp. C8]MBC3191579.1 hypothetical protein [Pseudonocardia sp. C8]
MGDPRASCRASSTRPSRVPCACDTLPPRRQARCRPARRATRRTLPPRDGTLSPRDGTLPPRDGTLSPRDGTLPPRDGTLPPRDGTLPPRDGTLSPR